tara:strand:+ start:16 stop:213 length:198 start_codon:yes stop_codon:yes gene_type:complete
MSNTKPKMLDQSGTYIFDEIGVTVWYDGVVARIWQEQREALRPRDQVINTGWQAVMSASPATTEE